MSDRRGQSAPSRRRFSLEVETPAGDSFYTEGFAEDVQAMLRTLALGEALVINRIDPY